MSALFTSVSCVKSGSCDSDDIPKCVGNVLWTCQGEGDSTDWFRTFDWVKADCGNNYCRISEGADPAGVCSLTPDLDPACENVSGTGPFCSSNRMIQCLVGYRFSEVDCGAKFCASGVDGVFAYCADADVDSECRAKCPERICEYCSGDTVVSCRYDHRYEEKVCASNEYCNFDDIFIEAQCSPK